MINFSVPDYTWHAGLYLFFQDLYESAPQFFIPNRKISSVYGLPGQLIWSGGRHIPPMDHFEARRRIIDLKNKGLSIKHVCTNCLLEPHHFLDSACNYWLKINEAEGDSVIIYDDRLADYIQSKYPKYNIILSTTRGKMTANEYNQAMENHLGTVLYYSDNNNDELLKQIKYPENIEIIAGEECEPNCPCRKFHYELESRIALDIDTESDNNWTCSQDRRTNFWADIADPRECTLTNERIDFLYNTYGFNQIKLSGRDQPKWGVLERLLYYFILPEYRDIIRFEAKLMIKNL